MNSLIVFFALFAASNAWWSTPSSKISTLQFIIYLFVRILDISPSSPSLTLILLSSFSFCAILIVFHRHHLLLSSSFFYSSFHFISLSSVQSSFCSFLNCSCVNKYCILFSSICILFASSSSVSMNLSSLLYTKKNSIKRSTQNPLKPYAETPLCRLVAQVFYV